MRLSRLDIRFLAAELDKTLAGAVVRTCGSPEANHVAIEFRRPGESATLEFLLDSRFPAVWLAGDRVKVKPPRGGSRFIVELARDLGGCWLDAARQWEFEREIVFQFRRGRETEGYDLHFQAYGTAPNLILTASTSSHVLAAHVAGGKTGIVMGQPYTPPISSGVLLPELPEWPKEVATLLADVDGERSLARASGQSGLPEGFLRRLMRQISQDPRSVDEELREMQHRLKHEAPRPTVVDQHEKGPELRLFPPGPTETVDHETFPSLSAAIESLAETVSGSGRVEIRKQMLLILNREMKAERRKLENIEQDIEDARNAERDRHFGELLLTHAHGIETGTSLAVVPDPANEDAQVEIPLDPRLSASANAQRFFERYKRKRRKTGIADERLEETRKRIERLELLIEETGAAEGEEAILDAARKAAREAPQILSLLREDAPARSRQSGIAAKGGKSRKENDPLTFARLFYSADGFRLLAGKDAKGNDELVRRAAHGNDLWFHTEGYAGSHVVVKRDGFSGEIPHETLLDAAQMAAHYSSVRGDSQVVVHYTECKYVRKPKGLPPGKVLYSRQKTLIVAPDPRRVERLSKSVQEKEIEELFKD